MSTTVEGVDDGLHQHPPTPDCVESIADSSESIRHACGGILDFSPRPSLAFDIRDLDISVSGIFWNYSGH